MAETVRNRPVIHPGGHQIRGVCMPQVVESDVREPDSGEARQVIAVANVAGGERSPRGTAKKQSAALESYLWSQGQWTVPLIATVGKIFKFGDQLVQIAWAPSTPSTAPPRRRSGDPTQRHADLPYQVDLDIDERW